MNCKVFERFRDYISYLIITKKTVMKKILILAQKHVLLVLLDIIYV